MKRLIIFFVCVTFALQAQAEVITFFAAGSVDGRLKTVPGSWVTIDWEDEAPSFFALAKAIGEPDEGWVYFSRSDMMTSATLTTYESIERLTFSNGVYMLTALNLDGAPSIQTVDCRDVGLVSIGIANSANLTNLLCDQNNLTDLDVTNNVNLSTLSCTKNHLTLSVLKQISATMLANGVPLANIRLAEQSLGATFLIINRLFEMPTEETINGKQTYYTVTKEGGATAIPGTDYSITGKQITFHQLGTYKVTMKNEGLVHYDGESENLVFAEYIVHQETPMVDTIPEQVYTGYPIEPPLTVMFDDSLLTPGVDYTVE
ncbi:MAG: hypothetical protein LBT48_03810, partial [Prevotellaceae bacterium]|nr:hypothetical protein [Prevotellaceae bacterium]